MKRFNSAQQLQHFVSFDEPIAKLFVFRHDIPFVYHCELRATGMQMCSDISHLKQPHAVLPAIL
ncbi:hypothetical protein [Rhizobium sp. HT1-10]|uniref:hypothetical protein n=1 Tax=Rhizobium sp. HT1-10 TaxID=3111638 RepID=UPI003C27CD56